MAVFEGARADLEIRLPEFTGKFYVYELMKPDKSVFYVGKGTKRRVIEHELEARRNHVIGESNPFKCNVIRKIIREGGAVGYRIDSTYEADCEEACLIREAELIQHYGRLHEGGMLTNLAGGLGNMSGAAPHSIEKHAATLSGAPDDNPERAVLNTFLQSIGPVSSVPIKPVRQISRILPTTPHPKKRSPTVRCAYALLASASAHGLEISPGVRIPRRFRYEGVEGIIENGVARDMLKAKMADLVPADDPKNEAFQLSAQQCALLAKLAGEAQLEKLGLI